MSERPLPPSFGGPSPRRRWTVPCLVPAGTRSSLEPCSVGTSTVAPRIASGIVSGTSTSRGSPWRRKTGDSSTWVATKSSPGGPPLRPGSPLPASRTRLPSRTPAGMLTRYFLTVLVAPVPAHVGHGSSMTVPEPPQRVHGCEIENRPWPCDSTPRPWQRGHVFGAVPGLAPVPWHVAHSCETGTCSGTWPPRTDCSKLIETSASRSRPRSWRGPRRACPRGAPAPPPLAALPNRSRRMSPKPPASKPPENPPLPAPPAPPPPPKNDDSPPRSYCLRLSGSPRTS